MRSLAEVLALVRNESPILKSVEALLEMRRLKPNRQLFVELPHRNKIRCFSAYREEQPS